jgi:hypothetical protein
MVYVCNPSYSVQTKLLRPYLRNKIIMKELSVWLKWRPRVPSSWREGECCPIEETRGWRVGGKFQKSDFSLFLERTQRGLRSGSSKELPRARVLG